MDSKGVYERFASSLFDTEVKITFASNLDEYGVKAEATNVKITEQYAVSAQTRKYNGLHLLKHALQNTSPDITKTVLNGWTANGGRSRCVTGRPYSSPTAR